MPALRGQAEQPVEHHRHHLAVGHPVALDKSQPLLGVEMLHHDGRAPHAQRRRHARLGRRVIQRCRVEVGHARAEPEQARTNSITGNGWPGPPSGSSRRMPLGWPVVPDEYSMAAPSDSSGTGASGYLATTAS